MKMFQRFALTALITTFALGNACDDPQLMAPAAGSARQADTESGVESFGRSGPGATKTTNSGENGSSVGTVGTMCAAPEDCGSDATCVAGTCEANGALIVALTWDANADFDLHLVQPNGEEVYYRNRVTDAGAEFSHDACIADRCEPGTPRREMVRYHSVAPGGQFRVFVVNHDGVEGGTANIEVVQHGQTQTFSASLEAQAGAQTQEFTFDVQMTESCVDGLCQAYKTCSGCEVDCGACTVTHETEFVTWNMFNNAGCTARNGIAKWTDRNNGPGRLSMKAVLEEQNPSILALQEDGKLGPDGCMLGNVKDKVAGWLSGTHDVRSTDDVAGGASGERLGIFIRKSKYRFINSGYQECTHNGAEVRGFMWAQVDLIEDNTSNHFYVLNAHFKARSTAADVAERMSQAQCVTRWVSARKAAHPNRAHFLLGDLNSGPDHNPDAYRMLTGPDGLFENTSTAGPDRINTHGSNWIDHVLGTKGDFTKAGYSSWTVGAGQVQNGGKLSDHLGLRTRIGHLR